MSRKIDRVYDRRRQASPILAPAGGVAPARESVLRRCVGGPLDGRVSPLGLFEWHERSWIPPNVEAIREIVAGASEELE